MADASLIQEELLAALGMHQDPVSDTPALAIGSTPSNSQPQGQQNTQAASDPTIPLDSPPTPAAATAAPPFTLPPVHLVSSALPALPNSSPPASTATAVTTATATAAAASTDPSPSSFPLGPLPVTEPSFDGSSDALLDISQSLSQALASRRPDEVLHPLPQPARVTTHTSAPQDPPRPRSPKRPRSPDGLDAPDIKRARVGSPAPTNGDILGPPDVDLALMLNDALATFDETKGQDATDVVMSDANQAQPSASVIDLAPERATPELEKVENKIMKASSNPFYVMRSMSLPVLGNVAVQILLRLSQQPLAETEALLSDANSAFRKAYDMLRDMFRPIRKAFSDSPLLSPDELDITDSEDRETIRMSNLGATAASVLGAHDVSLHEVHDAFFSIFIPEDGEYRSSLTDLLVSLKTRLLLDALNKPDQSQPVAQLLDTLFPTNFADALKLQSGDPVLNADEEALVAKLRERRDQLVKSAADESIKQSLEGQSSPGNLAASLSALLQSHLGIVVDYAEKYGVNIPLHEEDPASPPDQTGAEPEEHDSLVALLQSATSHLDQPEATPALAHGIDGLQNGMAMDLGLSLGDGEVDLKKLIEDSLSTHTPELKDPATGDQHLSAGLPDFDSKNLASFISEKLKSELDSPHHSLPNVSAPVHPPNHADIHNAAVHSQYLAQMAQTHSSPHQAHPQGSVPTQRLGPKGEILPPNQSMTTSMLYERARQAAVAKSSNTTRREGLHSTRRPWTPEEEKALMAGLDTVKGPHWSQILSLYGLNGSVCDILKDRTQVQLKDKARNLKLFFLKTNSEMPYYLQSVTGELKTRAPGQAARKEAEEKARMSMEEEQARIHGMMAMGGGMQSGSHSVANTPLAASPSKRVSPAAAGFGGPGVAATAAPTVAHATASNGTSLPAAQMHPRVKVEPLDQHALPKMTAFPPIQPAPSPSPAMQQARAPLPALQPQPALQHQQAKPQTQQFQQPPQVRPQEAQKPPLPQQQQQPQRPPQAPPQSIPPQRAQPAAAHQPAQAQPHGLPRPAQPSPHPQASHQSPPRAPPAPMGQAPPQAQPLPLPTPPIPPNHHTGRDHAQGAKPHETPASQQHAGQDHAQDARLYETLQAAIAASSSPGEGHLPLAATAPAAAVAEGSGN
ncbi:hypothetical protein C8A05DRAFT_16613 [Staphylotrichum tortipilum]|uniref:HTH myb-type domain-containing protein n=1 Tax=Staphylotrichum tortipilum TaxID=2831512 RepID=A0AAN6MIG5_9PEZI|nr:hypothetical protein C8A05DRAFT_16613 [Staphylotrichum longicolle]